MKYADSGYGPFSRTVETSSLFPQVDFCSALAALSERYGIKKVQVDSGGTLNGVLLQQELVDEINLLIYPYLVGGTTTRSIFRSPDLIDSASVIQLKLVHTEQIREDILWLQYEVVRLPLTQT
ncbi:MAG: dihydrofolate reductase family protein [Cyanobacteria bacterium J06621_11]